MTNSVIDQSGKELFEWIEIDQDLCSNEYGDAGLYPLTDTGPAGAQIDPTSSVQQGDPAQSYEAATFTFTGAGSPSRTIALPGLDILEGKSYAFEDGDAFAFEVEVTQDPVNFITGIGIAAYEIDENNNPTGVQYRASFASFIGIFCNIWCRDEGFGGTTTGSILRANVQGATLGLKIDTDAGTITAYGKNGSDEASTEFAYSNAPTPGNRFIWSVFADDSGIQVAADTTTLLVHSAASAYVIPWPAGTKDWRGNVISDYSSNGGLCRAQLSTASPEKCFNTVGTCQRLEDYVPTFQTLRFCKSQAVKPNDGLLYMPFLQTVSYNPSSINPGGADDNKKALGSRANIRATLSDHPYSDNGVDPYAGERIIGTARLDGVGYSPFERSTFWRKWLARNQWRVSRPLRYCTAYLNDAGQIVDQVTRTFTIEEINGPGKADQVDIRASDILTKIEKKQAQIPAASEGKLSADVTVSATGFSVTPAGVGATYTNSGYITINDEVSSYTRSGDTFTFSTRGLFGTSAGAHSSGDTVQQSEYMDSLAFWQILETLLEDFAGIPAANLDVVQWQAEATAYLPRAYSRLFAKPISVFEAVSELCQDAGFFAWFDERDNLVKVRAVRAADQEVITDITSTANLVADSTELAEQAAQQITTVVIHYGRRTPINEKENPASYAVTDIFVSDAYEGPDYTDGKRIKTIFAQYLDSADGAAAEELGERILNAYQIPPRKINFSLEAKDRDLWLGDFVNISTPQNVDAYGEEQTFRAQILQVQETKPGSEYKYMAQRFFFEAIDPTAKSVDISADDYNVNLRTLHDAKYTTAPTAGENIYFTVRAGVVIGSTSSSTPAMVSGSWPAGVNVYLILEAGAFVVGKGGYGGDYDTTGPGAIAPEAGGVGFSTTYAITLTNYGVIGGGGGGGGAASWINAVGSESYTYTGGGGAGRDAGIAYDGQRVAPSPADPYAPTTGQPGGLELGGAGGDNGKSGYAGDGGDLGQAGADGYEVPIIGAPFYNSGAAAGDAVQGWSSVTVDTEGDIRGAKTG